MADVTDLRQLVLRQLAVLGDGTKPMSHREAAARSGGKVSHATIGNIAGGRHSGKIDESTIEGLALGLDLKPSEIRAAIQRYHVAAGKPFEVPERWQRLTHVQRKLVIALGDGLLAAYEQGRDDQAEFSTGSLAHRTALTPVRDEDIGERAARRTVNRGKQMRAQLDQLAEAPDPEPDDEP